MTAPESDRRVLHVEFDLTGGNNNSIGGDTKSTGCNTNSSLDYQPGDSIGVLPMNDSSLVAKIAKRLNLDLTSVFTCTWCISQIQAHCLLTQD
jgi:sulfite reductase alpha subunit-like flavoprotein